jgi:hypothetical protein
MTPKSVKDFMKDYAERNALPEEDFKDFMMAYYSNIRTCLSELEEYKTEKAITRLQFLGLGNFNIRVNKVQSEIHKLQGESYNSEYINPIRKRALLLPLIKVDEKVTEDWSKERTLSDLKREYKLTHDNKGNLKTGMGEQETDY